MDEGEPFVIGRQAADAAAADAAHVKGPSPLPWPDGAYGDGVEDLLRLPRADFDDTLSEWLRRAWAGGPATCAAVRDALDGARFDTLLTFGNRAAVRAMRMRDAAIVHDGLVAMALIDPARTDYRDVGMTLSLLQRAATRIGANAPALFDEVTTAAMPRTAEMMSGTVAPEVMSYPLSGRTGLMEFDTPEGPGLIRRGGYPYAPTIPIERIAFEMLAMIERDDYAGSVEIGQRLPSIWLSAGVARAIGRAIGRAVGIVRDIPVGEALERAPATICVQGDLRRRDAKGAQGQTLSVWILELRDEGDALALEQAAVRVAARRRPRLGVRCGRVLALVVASSWMATVHVGETAERLRRFERPLRDILARHCGAAS